jgi:hypothetical protein
MKRIETGSLDTIFKTDLPVRSRRLQGSSATSTTNDIPACSKISGHVTFLSLCLLFVTSGIARTVDAQISAAERTQLEFALRSLYEPSAMDETRIRGLAEQLGIEDDEAISSTIEAYQQSWGPLLEGPIKTIRDRWAACFSIDPQIGRIKTSYTPELTALLNARGEAFRAADAADAALFDRLRLAKRGDTISIDPSTATVRQRRKRRRELLGFPDRLPGTSIEAADLLTSVAADPELFDAVLPALDEWEIAVDTALVARWSRLEAIERMRAELEVDLGPGWRRLVDGEDRAALEAEFEALDDAMVATEIPRRKINADMVAGLAQRLPPLVFLHVVRRHHELAHPALFVEDQRLDRLIFDVLESNDIDEPSKKDVESLLAATAERLNRLGVDAARQADLTLQSQYRHVGESVPFSKLADGPNIDDDIQALQDEISLLNLVLKRRKVFDQLARPLAGLGPEIDLRVRHHRAATSAFDRRDEWSRDRFQETVDDLRLIREQASWAVPATFDESTVEAP